MNNTNRTKARRETTKTMPTTLPLGELVFCTDTNELYVGRGSDTPINKVIDPEVIQKQKELTSQLDSNVQEVNQVKNDYAKKVDINTLATNKPNKNEVVLKGFGVLSDFDEETRRVLQGLTQGQINAVLGKNNVQADNLGVTMQSKVANINNPNEGKLVNFEEKNIASTITGGMNIDGTINTTSLLNRTIYELEVGSNYRIIGVLDFTECVAYSQASGASNSNLVTSTKKIHTGSTIVYNDVFKADYPYLFITINKDKPFKLFKIKDVFNEIDNVSLVSKTYTDKLTTRLDTLVLEDLDLKNEILNTTGGEVAGTIGTDGLFLNTGNMTQYEVEENGYYHLVGKSNTINNRPYGLYAFYTTPAFSGYLPNSVVLAEKSENIVDVILKAPTGAKYMRVSRGSYLSSDIKLYKINTKTENFKFTQDKYDEMRINRVCDDSTIKCMPYFLESLGWNTYNPRLNILLFPDFNDEVNLLVDTAKWFNDDLVDRSIGFIASAGDSVNAEAGISSARWIAKANTLTNAINVIKKPFVFCVGNHDTGEDGMLQSNANTMISRQGIYNNWFKPLIDRLKLINGADTVFQDSSNPNSMYYYVDLVCSGRKVRVFAMNESEYPLVFDQTGQLKYSMCATNRVGNDILGGFNSYYSQKQLQFLVNALKTCENDRLFIIMNHINYDKNGGRGSLCGSKEALYGIINAFRNNSSSSVTIQGIETIPQYTINADFTSLTGTHPMIHLKGHDHYFNCNKISSEGNVYEVMGTTGGTPSTQIKCKNSVAQYGCDILSVDKNNQAYFLRFGYAPTNKNSGQDRDGFHYIDNPISLI